jgi:hypothetical protein
VGAKAPLATAWLGLLGVAGRAGAAAASTSWRNLGSAPEQQCCQLWRGEVMGAAAAAHVGLCRQAFGTLPFLREGQTRFAQASLELPGAENNGVRLMNISVDGWADTPAAQCSPMSCRDLGYRRRGVGPVRELFRSMQTDAKMNEMSRDEFGRGRRRRQPFSWRKAFFGSILRQATRRRWVQIEEPRTWTRR